MRTTNRVVEVASSLLVDDKGRALYSTPDATRTSGDKTYASFTGKDALIVADNSDFASPESFRHLDNACRSKYGKGVVEIINGQGLPLTATNYVQARIKLTVVSSTTQAMAEKIAAKFGTSVQDVLDAVK